ncbi:MAG TPA: hypothetical protein VG298_02905 [Acidimicrobiales bacterium]|nr:hypothetical protein [Acidimicrobiales bacterium]
MVTRVEPHQLDGLGLKGKVPRRRRLPRRPERNRGRWNFLLAVAASLSLVVPVLAIAQA